MYQYKKREKTHYLPVNQIKKKKHTGLSVIPPYADEEQIAQVQTTGLPLQAKLQTDNTTAPVEGEADAVADEVTRVEYDDGGYILISDKSGNPLEMIKLSDAKEMAMLALHVYGPDKEGEYKEQIPPGWRTLAPEELRELGLVDRDLVNEATGFKSQLYKNDAEGRYVYVFAGTDYGEGEDAKYVATIKGYLSKHDQINNLRQGAGLESKQYVQAFDTTQELLKKINKSELQLAGHSLGGGMASFVGTVWGLQTITFNAAGVNKWGYLKKHYGLDVAEADKYVTAFYRVGDILHYYQEDNEGTKGLLPDAIGRQIAVVVKGDKTLTGLPEKRRVEGIKRHENLKDLYDALAIFK